MSLDTSSLAIMIEYVEKDKRTSSTSVMVEYYEIPTHRKIGPSVQSSSS